MKLIDTHIHLYSEQYRDDLDAVIQRASGVGVHSLLMPAIDSSYTPAMLQTRERYRDTVSIMAGLHPTSVKENYHDELDHAFRISEEHPCVGIGEIGVDLYWDTTYKKEQLDAFAVQLDWAKQKKLPVSVHGREAFDEILTILERKQDGALQGVLHCFTGTYEQALRLIDLGFYLGIGGVITFKNGKIDRFMEQIDPSCLVLETDGPYLAPVPYRGKRNEPAYIKHVVEKLSGIYGIPEEEIARITTRNAVHLFGIQ